MKYAKEQNRIAAIRRHLLLVVLFGIFITGILTSISITVPFYFSAQNYLEKITLTSLQSRANSLDNLFGKYQDLARQFTSRSVIRDELEKYTQGHLSLAELSKFTYPKLDDAQRLSDELIGLVRLSLKGDEIVRLGELPADFIVELEPIQNYLDITEPQFDLINLGSNLTVRVAANIFSSQGEVLGQDILYFSCKGLAQVISDSLNLDSRVLLYLSHLPSLNKAVYQAAKQDLSLSSLEDAERIKSLELASQCSECVQSHEHTYQNLIFYTPLKGTHWALVLEAPKRIFYSLLRQQIMWPLLALMVMLVAAVFVMSKALQPLTRRLATQAQELQESTEELRLVSRVFADAREAIAITDTNMQLIKVNSAFSQILGYSAEDSFGKNLQGFFMQKKAVDKFQAQIDASLLENESWQGEIWYCTAQGVALPVLQSISGLVTDAGVISNYIHIFNDISESKAAEKKINYLAHYDQLTDLPNRTYLRLNIKKALQKAEANNTSLAILFMDLDHFKQVNDTLGHSIGDLLLQAVAQRLSGLLRDKDMLGRLGGDEFLLLLDGNIDKQAAGSVADKIIAALLQPFNLDGHQISIGVSVGIALYPIDGKDADELVKNADIAMYSAKEAGRNTYRYFMPET